MRSESLRWAARGAGLAVGVGLVLVLAYMASLARDVLILVFLAVLLGAALEPVVGFIRGRTGIGRGLSILIVYAVFLAAVVGIAVFIVPAALVQLGNALTHVPAFLEQVRESKGVMRAAQPWPMEANPLGTFERALDPALDVRAHPMGEARTQHLQLVEGEPLEVLG